MLKVLNLERWFKGNSKRLIPNAVNLSTINVSFGKFITNKFIGWYIYYKLILRIRLIAYIISGFAMPKSLNLFNKFLKAMI